MNFPITQFTREQKGKTVKYVRAYLAEGKEEEGRRLADQLSRRRRGREYRRDRVRLRKLILGARDALKTQRFRLGFLFIIFFPSPRRVLALSRSCPIIKKKRKDTRAAVSQAYAYDTGTAGKWPCPCFLVLSSSSVCFSLSNLSLLSIIDPFTFKFSSL